MKILWISFARWSGAGGRWFTWHRWYRKGWKWTPFIIGKRRKSGKTKWVMPPKEANWGIEEEV
jgi:hypothetical protein